MPKKATIFECTYRDYLARLAGIDFLPKIPVVLRFNDTDQDFPAQCTLLFRASAEKHLDMECLAIGGTFLSDILIGKT